MITPPRAPSLPAAPIEYSRQYHNELNSALRMYFNRVDTLVAMLVSSTNLQIVDADPASYDTGDTWILMTAGTPNTYEISVATADGIKRTSLT